MTPTDGAAIACEVDDQVDSAPRARECRRLRCACTRPRSVALVDVGENGLVDLRVTTVVRRLAEWALEYCEGDATWAAAELGVNVSTVRRWVKAWARDDVRGRCVSIVHALGHRRGDGGAAS